jgi:hypothetical protein
VTKEGTRCFLWFGSFTTVLYACTSTRCGTLAEALQTMSPDLLTRQLQADESERTSRNFAVRTWCVWSRVSLVLDDTVMSR